MSVRASDRSDVKRHAIETPSYQERVLFLGGNGSGKTIVLSHLIEPYPRCVILDIKYDFPIPASWEESGDYQVRNKTPGTGFLNALQWLWGSKRVIYRPQPPYDTGEEITKFLNGQFEWARKYGKDHPFILAVDEGGWTSYNGSKIALARIAISGRSIGIGFWICAQRPRGIPVEARSEAWRIIATYLKSKEDRKELINYLDGDIDEADFAFTANDYEIIEIRRGKGGRYTYRRLPPVKINT